MFETNQPNYKAECTGDSPMLIELAPMVIDYSLPLERMIGDEGRKIFVEGMEEFMEEPIRYAVDYFPNCKAGRTGKQWRNLLLFRPTPLDDRWGLPHILSVIDEAGFVPEELPSLASLAPISESLWTVFGGRAFFINSVGPNSLLARPNGESGKYGLCLQPFEPDLHVTSYVDEDGQSGGQSGCMTWYVVSRKADD
jgi:hypothetical protein